MSKNKQENTDEITNPTHPPIKKENSNNNVGNTVYNHPPEYQEVYIAEENSPAQEGYPGYESRQSKIKLK